MGWVVCGDWLEVKVWGGIEVMPDFGKWTILEIIGPMYSKFAIGSLHSYRRNLEHE